MKLQEAALQLECPVRILACIMSLLRVHICISKIRSINVKWWVKKIALLILYYLFREPLGALFKFSGIIKLPEHKRDFYCISACICKVLCTNASFLLFLCLWHNDLENMTSGSSTFYGSNIEPSVCINVQSCLIMSWLDVYLMKVNQKLDKYYLL